MEGSWSRINLGPFPAPSIGLVVDQPTTNYTTPPNPTKFNMLKQRRQANLYDAVAGRVAANGFISDTPYIVRTRGTTCTSSVPLPPEEVLFRRGMAPERYEENDFYWANQNLTDDQVLPDSDLLKAIHAYVAEFYGRATLDKGQSDIRSMDETALLALGILMEETAKEILGEAGDLVFVEGEEVQEDSFKYYESDIKIRQNSVPVRHESAGRTASKPAEGRKRKRRKIDHEPSE